MIHPRLHLGFVSYRQPYGISVLIGAVRAPYLLQDLGHEHRFIGLAGRQVWRSLEVVRRRRMVASEAGMLVIAPVLDEHIGADRGGGRFGLLWMSAS